MFDFTLFFGMVLIKKIANIVFISAQYLGCVSIRMCVNTFGFMKNKHNTSNSTASFNFVIRCNLSLQEEFASYTFELTARFMGNL